MIEEPKPWEIGGSPSDGYIIYKFDSTGDMVTTGPVFDHPCAAAEWCESHGYIWSIMHLAEGVDATEALAAWRAANPELVKLWREQ